MNEVFSGIKQVIGKNNTYEFIITKEELMDLIRESPIIEQIIPMENEDFKILVSIENLEKNPYWRTIGQKR